MLLAAVAQAVSHLLLVNILGALAIQLRVVNANASHEVDDECCRGPVAG